MIYSPWQERANSVAVFDRFFRIIQTVVALAIIVMWVIVQKLSDEETCTSLSRTVELHFKVSLPVFVFSCCFYGFVIVMDFFAANMLMHATNGNYEVKDVLFFSRFWFHLNTSIVLLGLVYIVIFIRVPPVYVAVGTEMMMRVYLLYVIHRFIQSSKEEKKEHFAKFRKPVTRGSLIA